MTAEAEAFRQFVLKVHSRCNLACTYCYLYEGPDATWRRRPARVGEDTVRRTAARIGAHLERHRLPAARVDLHGGEPLLGGPDTVLRYAAAVREAAPRDCALHFFVQTNGTLLTAGTLRRLAAAGIRVGLSLDGGTAAQNHRRIDHAGRPSWPAAHRAARLLADAPAAYAGILCTIDVRQDPLAVYESLLELAPPTLDLLLPHANWTAPPPGVPAPGPPGRTPRDTPYADWLIRIFDHWWAAASAESRVPTRIRLFEETVALLLGAPSRIESLGLSPGAAVVVETDGSIEQVDSLRSAYEGASATGLDVYAHDFDTARAAFTRAAPARAPVCRRCPVFRVCGGGNRAHRYAPGSGTPSGLQAAVQGDVHAAFHAEFQGGFQNPSVYCADLEALIRHIATTLRRTAHGELPAVDARCVSAT